MHLEHLRLLNFKNYEDSSIALSSQINCFTGNNGSGKTNILDAIHYLSLTKSAFSSSDTTTIRHENPFFSVLGTVKEDKKSINIRCSLKKGEKKVFKVDDEEYDRISEHIGRIPIVLIVPNDTDIIREGSESRRKFTDSILAQLDRGYLEALMKYNHIVKQRNSYLKQAFEAKKVDYTLLDSFDEQLLPLNTTIFQTRSAFIKEFTPHFLELYKKLCAANETVDLVYHSHLQGKDFEKRFKSAAEADYFHQRTTLGIHKDNLDFIIDGTPLKKFGSQGQQKTFVIALKLAQFEFMLEKTGKKPLLLLDDVFDKLDDQRIEQLLKMVAADRFGQIFITDARRERTQHFLTNIQQKKKKTDIRIFDVSKGTISDGEKI